MSTPWRLIGSGISEWIWAAVFVVTWISPRSLGSDSVGSMVGVVLLEFLLIHSTAFFAVVLQSGWSKPLRVKALLALGGFYALMALGFSLSLESFWPLIAMITLTLEKVWAVVDRHPERAGVGPELVILWAGSVVFYLFSTFACLFLPIPSLGVTGGLGNGGSGVWEQQPYIALATGAIYFFLCGALRIGLGLSQLRNGKS